MCTSNKILRKKMTYQGLIFKHKIPYCVVSTCLSMYLNKMSDTDFVYLSSLYTNFPY